MKAAYLVKVKGESRTVWVQESQHSISPVQHRSDATGYFSVALAEQAAARVVKALALHGKMGTIEIVQM